MRDSEDFRRVLGDFWEPRKQIGKKCETNGPNSIPQKWNRVEPEKEKSRPTRDAEGEGERETMVV